MKRLTRSRSDQPRRDALLAYIASIRAGTLVRRNVTTHVLTVRPHLTILRPGTRVSVDRDGTGTVLTDEPEGVTVAMDECPVAFAHRSLFCERVAVHPLR